MEHQVARVAEAQPQEGATMESQPPPARVVVRLFVYSGRADPEWPLDATAAQELTSRVKQALGKEAIHPPPAGGLGYRGFLVRFEAPADGLPRQLLVFHRVLVEQPGPRARSWRDTTGVEAYLLAEARRQGHGPVLDALGVPATVPE
jgi:hypothetical protein